MPPSDELRETTCRDTAQSARWEDKEELSPHAKEFDQGVEFVDDMSGAALDVKEVIQARREELTPIEGKPLSMQLPPPRSAMRALVEPLVSTKWIGIDKGAWEAPQ